MNFKFISLVIDNHLNKVVLYGLGSQSLLNLFFYNIDQHLNFENHPSLYRFKTGSLNLENVADAKLELKQIENFFLSLEHTKLAISDSEELSFLIEQKEIDQNATNLATIFLTDTGVSLINILNQAFDDALRYNGSISFSIDEE